MEITRAEGTGRFLKRFDFIAREISSFAAREAKRGCEKTRKKATEQSPVSHMTFGLPIHLPSGFRFPILPLRFSRPPQSLFYLTLFSISRSGEGRLHSHRMANWTRNFILPDERPPRPERGRKGFRKNAIFPSTRKTKNVICTWKWIPKWNSIWQRGRSSYRLYTMFSAPFISISFLQRKMWFLRILHLSIPSRILDMAPVAPNFVNALTFYKKEYMYIRIYRVF